MLKTYRGKLYVVVIISLPVLLAGGLLLWAITRNTKQVCSLQTRVISLSPSLTETMFQLGQGKLLVGRSNSCNYPEEAKQIVAVGNFGDPNLEKLLSLYPNVVIASSFRDIGVKKMLEDIGIKVLLLESKSIDDYRHTVRVIGEEFDCRKSVTKELARIDAGITAFQKKVDAIPFDKRPKVYFEIWHSPLMTAGNKSFINDYITLGGGRNIASKQSSSYFTCSGEWVVNSNPDVIICPSMGKENIGKIGERIGWNNLSAVNNNRIYGGLDKNIIFRPGPRLLEAIELISNCIRNHKKI